MAEPVAAAVPPDLWGSIVQSFGVLLLVLALLVFVLWLVKRYAALPGTGGAQGRIRVLGALHLAPKERVMLLDVLGEKILVGVTAQQVSFLARIQDEKGVCDRPCDPPEGFFKSLLRRRMQASPEHPPPGETAP